MNGWVGEWMDGWLDGWMDGWMDGQRTKFKWMDGQTNLRKEASQQARKEGRKDGWMVEWGGCTGKHTNVQTKVTDSPEASISKAKSIGLGQPSKHNGKKAQVRLVFTIMFVSRRKK